MVATFNAVSTTITHVCVGIYSQAIPNILGEVIAVIWLSCYQRCAYFGIRALCALGPSGDRKARVVRRIMSALLAIMIACHVVLGTVQVTTGLWYDFRAL